MSRNLDSLGATRSDWNVVDVDHDGDKVLSFSTCIETGISAGGDNAELPECIVQLIMPISSGLAEAIQWFLQKAHFVSIL